MHHPIASQQTESGFHIEPNPYGFNPEHTPLLGHASFNIGTASSDLSTERFDLQSAQAGLSRSAALSTPLITFLSEELALAAAPSDLKQTGAGDVLTGLSAATALVRPTDASLQSRLFGTLDSTDLNNPLRSGSFYDGYYLAGLAAGEQVQVRVNSSAFDTYLQIINADTGTLVAFDDDSGPGLNSQLTFTVQAETDYIIQVSSFGVGEVGNYQLNSSAGQLNPAAAMQPNQTVQGALVSSDAEDKQFGDYYYDGYYISNLTAGQTVQINLSSSQFDTYLQLVDADTGDIIAMDDDGGPGLNSQLTFVAQADTNYIVQATSYASNTTGSYTLTTSVNGGSPTPGFSSFYGYGHVDAAALVATALGQSAFANVPDLGGDQWNLDQVGAPEVWAQGYTGQGVVVAVIDTGVDYNHVALADNIWANAGEVANNGIDDDGNGYIDDVQGWDFAYDDNDPMDNNGHGTHVAGTVAATGANQVTGVAPDAAIMPIQVLMDNGFGTNADISEGIVYAVDNGADVINLSLGGTFSADIRDAVEYAWNQGVAVIMAAGNEYDFQPGFPAKHATDWGIAVGAVDINRQIPAFANYAGSVVLDYVVAPGVDIVSTTPGNNYDAYSGTSMAAPHVAGVAALLLSAVPTLTVDQLENLIIGTANPTGITA
ncbi:MAG: S8 family peptidase [Thainema sp.]